MVHIIHRTHLPAPLRAKRTVSSLAVFALAGGWCAGNLAASASSSGDAPSATSVLSPFSRFDVLDEAAARCDELRRMTDEDPFQACSKRLAHKTSKALIGKMDVPAPWVEALGNPFADWFKSRYSKEAIRLLQFDFASNLCFVSGMPFVVPSKSSGTFCLLELVGSHCIHG